MLRREDMFMLDGVCNTYSGDHEVTFKTEMTLAHIQDVIGGLIEAAPEATSFSFNIVRVTHTSEDRSEDDVGQKAH